MSCTAGNPGISPPSSDSPPNLGCTRIAGSLWPTCGVAGIYARMFKEGPVSWHLPAYRRVLRDGRSRGQSLVVMARSGSVGRLSILDGAWPWAHRRESATTERYVRPQSRHRLPKEPCGIIAAGESVAVFRLERWRVAFGADHRGKRSPDGGQLMVGFLRAFKEHRF